MKEGRENNETLNGSDEKSTIPPPSRWDNSLDPSFCHFLAGSFGKRQGLELHSDMGPFVHSFQRDTQPMYRPLPHATDKYREPEQPATEPTAVNLDVGIQHSGVNDEKGCEVVRLAGQS